MKKFKEKLDPEEWYSINQIGKMKIIYGMGFMGVRKLVENGQLPAARLKATKDAQVRYRIQGRYIIEYLKKNNPK